MIDNLTGSISDAVEKLQAQRNESTAELEQPTGETVDESYDESEPEVEEQEYGGQEVEEPESYEDSEDEAPQYRTIKANGEEKRLTFDELDEYASKGLDYTQKTMALAEDRKKFEESSQAELQKLTELSQSLESLLKESEAKIDWDELRDTDPSEYLRQKELNEKRKEAASKAREEQLKVYNEALQKRKDEENVKLSTYFNGEYKDDKAITGAVSRITASMRDDYGISDQERANIFDSRLFRMADDASKYRELKRNEGKVKEVRQAPKTVKTGKAAPKRIDKHVQDRQQALKKTGRVDDAVALLQAKRNKR